jgi:hypothetical protein
VAPKTQEDLELLRDAAREVEARFTPKAPKFPFWQQQPTTSKVRFGAHKGFADHSGDGLSTKPAPAPKGPPTETLIEEARRRRREREREGGR